MKKKWFLLYGFMIMAILLGGIYLAKEAGIWQASGKINPDGSRVTIEGKTVNEIKGWTTLGDVINGFGLNKEEVYNFFELTEDTSLDTELKDLAALTDERLSPSTMRDYISETLGLEAQDSSQFGKNKSEEEKEAD